jgi:hypothetical protein
MTIVKRHETIQVEVSNDKTGETLDLLVEHKYYSNSGSNYRSNGDAGDPAEDEFEIIKAEPQGGAEKMPEWVTDELIRENMPENCFENETPEFDDYDK